MNQNHEGGLREILFRHARNLLRITSIPSRKEVEEFRNLIRVKLEGAEEDIKILLQDIQDSACHRAEMVAAIDHSLHEYYMAVYTETEFLLGALTTERWTFPPRFAETA